MIFRFIYSQYEANRLIPAVLIDSRATIPAIKNQVGSVIKSYTDGQVYLVGETSIFYKIETDQGNLAGYFTLKYIALEQVVLTQFQLRTCFSQFESIISTQIANFIQSGDWKLDYLY